MSLLNIKRLLIVLVGIGTCAAFIAFFVPATLTADVFDDARRGECIPEAGTKRLGGRAWNSSIGWLTQDFDIRFANNQSVHCYLGLKQDRQDETLGEVTGWSWSRFGYACWGKTCKTQARKNKAPDGNDPKVIIEKSPNEQECRARARLQFPDNQMDNVDELRARLASECFKSAKHVLKGWLYIPALEGKTSDNGWICLSPITWPAAGSTTKTGCDTLVGDNRAIEYGVLFDPLRREFFGSAWSSAVGWIVFSGSTLAEKDREICEGKADRIIRQDATLTAQRQALIAQCLYDIGRVSYSDTLDDSLRRCADKVGSDAAKIKERMQCLFDMRNIDYKIADHLAIGDDYPICETKAQGVIIADPQRNMEHELAQCLFDRNNLLNALRLSKWKTSYIAPGIAVKGGNVYSETGFGGTANTVSFVDYLIFTPGSKNNFQELCRESSPELCKQFSKKIGSNANDPPEDRERKRLRRAIEMPATQSNTESKQPATKKESNQAILKSPIGTINVSKLIARNARNKNVYGNTVKILQGAGTEITDTALDGGNGCNLLSSPRMQSCGGLGNTVVVIEDKNFRISEAMRFSNSSWASQESGGTTFVINGGNLLIDQNLLYEQSQVNRLDKLASVAWIVLAKNGDTAGSTGNIIFGDCMKPDLQLRARASGVFYAEGKIKTGTGNGKNCIFANGDVPLVVNGIMVAKSFDFARDYEGDGAETIDYDGRLLVSIPPGLSDMVATLPKWTQ